MTNRAEAHRISDTDRQRSIIESWVRSAEPHSHGLLQTASAYPLRDCQWLPAMCVVLVSALVLRMCYLLLTQ